MHTLTTKSKMNFNNPTPATYLPDNIGKLVDCDDVVIETMLNNSKEIEISRGDIINNEGNLSRYLYFIISGKARMFYVDQAGKTITWSFHFNDIHSTLMNLFIIDYKSFFTQASGKMHVEAITDIRLIRIGKRGLWDKFEGGSVMEKCLQKLHEHSFIATYERMLNLLTQSARERYNHLLHDEPHLLQIFADKYLASYIGIEPQSLSRIRKNLRSSPPPHSPFNFT
jgi:CRP/FNR family transcriptional regulator, anaerobic regulatory protein